jgi:hypothetical protein
MHYGQTRISKCATSIGHSFGAAIIGTQLEWGSIMRKDY